MNYYRRSLFYLLASILLLATGYGESQTEVQSEEKSPVNCGFFIDLFKGVSVSDSKAAFKVFVDELLLDIDVTLESNVYVFNDKEEFYEAITNLPLHMAVVGGWEYYTDELQDIIQPQVVVSSKGILNQYYLLVRTDSGIQKIEDLRNKTIAWDERATNSEPWLKTLLLEKVGESIPLFFKETVIESKPNKVLLPVFFGKVDACVLNQSTYESMCELNPQLGLQIRSIAKSDRLLESIGHLSRTGWKDPTHREKIYEAYLNIESDPFGQQLLSLFRADQIVPFDSEFLTGIQSLNEKYRRLMKENNIDVEPKKTASESENVLNAEEVKMNASVKDLQEHVDTETSSLALNSPQNKTTSSAANSTPLNHE